MKTKQSDTLTLSLHRNDDEIPQSVDCKEYIYQTCSECIRHEYDYSTMSTIRISLGTYVQVGEYKDLNTSIIVGNFALVYILY